MLTVDDVSKDVGVLLNDPARTRFTYAKQLPYINIAYTELQEHLQNTNMPMTNNTSTVIPVSVGQATLTLPVDLISPIVLYEKTTGTAEDFIEMTQVEFLPKVHVLTNALIYWVWMAQQIGFLGANTPRDVKIDYTASVFIPLVNPTDSIPYFNARTFLANRGAALCAEFIGENDARADKLNGYATVALDRVLGINTKEKQSIRTRRRPFRAGYKSTSYV